MLKEKYIKIVNDLIEEADLVVGSQFRTRSIGSPVYVDSQILHRWWGKIKSLENQLGLAAKPWREDLTKNPDRPTLGFVKRLLGTLEAIKYEIENDHLESISKMVKADTLADLIEQAEYLQNGGYFLAAGVIGRAVLEEYLRDLCGQLNLTFKKKNPTISDYNLELYSEEYYSKIKMKQIDTLAAIGNNAAHNKPELDKGDVKMLIQDLPNLIESTGV